MNYNETCGNQTLLLKLKKISYLGTLFKVQFIQVSMYILYYPW